MEDEPPNGHPLGADDAAGLLLDDEEEEEEEEDDGAGDTADTVR